MKIVNLYPGSWCSNCYLVENGNHAVIIDPSAPADMILSRLQKDGVTLDAILLTHGHFDHILSADSLRDRLPELKMFLHKNDAELPPDPYKNAYALLCGAEQGWRPAEQLLSAGDCMTVGETHFTVLHTPGHTRGSVSFLFEEEGVLFTGDTLFADNIGRFDLYGGDGKRLFETLHELSRLSPTLTIYPGHGGTAPLGEALARVLP